PGAPRADHRSTAARPEYGRAAVEPTCSAGGDHFLAFAGIACTLICYRRLAK
ncbi:Mobile element protein, partial [Streptomyces globisporus]